MNFFSRPSASSDKVTGSKDDLSTTPSYNSAGGGEASFDPSPSSLLHSVMNYFYDEIQRPSRDPVVVRGPDLHQRLPVWMESKDVDIFGQPLSEKALNDVSQWRAKYKKELEVADAVVSVKSKRIQELDNGAIAAYRKVQRWLGNEPPLCEKDAQAAAEQQWEEKISLLAKADNAKRAGSKDPSLSSSGAIHDGPPISQSALGTAWTVLMRTAQTGRPLVQVAAEYRPRVDFYGLDAFIDSRPSFIWFWTKLGMFIGLAQGTARATQAITSDFHFLRASGVGVLSVLNMSVLAGVVKWGGNSALLAAAFCVGDGLVSTGRSLLLPTHETSIARRTTSNYAVGLALAGSTVGVMPWWMLHDSALATRLAISGLCVGGGLGIVVGYLLRQLVSINLSRLDATPRHLRRYEALVLRQREWVEGELKASRKGAVVWW